MSKKPGHLRMLNNEDFIMHEEPEIEGHYSDDDIRNEWERLHDKMSYLDSKKNVTSFCKMLTILGPT